MQPAHGVGALDMTYGLRGVTTGTPRTTPQPRVEQAAHGVAEHVETEDGDRPDGELLEHGTPTTGLCGAAGAL